MPKHLPVFFFVTVVVLVHVVVQWPMLAMPLMSDEFIYANPAVLDNPGGWVEYSSLHPPGWHLLTWLVYSVFGFSTVVAKAMALFFSSVFLAGMIWLVYLASGSLLPATFFILLVYSSPFFMTASALNYPVIATALLGFSALFFVRQQRLWLASFFLVLAVLTRETALVFVPAACLLEAERKKWIWFLPPVLALGLIYGWIFLQTGTLRLNAALTSNDSSGPTRFEQGFLQAGRMWGFYGELLAPFSLAAALLLAVILLYLVWLGSIRRQPLSTWIRSVSGSGFPGRPALALAFIFCVHSLFFASFYHHAPHDYFVSHLALSALLTILLAAIPLPRVFLIALPLALAVFTLPRHIEFVRVDRMFLQNEVRLTKELADYIRASPQIDARRVLVSRSLAQPLRNKNFGFVSESMPVMEYVGSLDNSKVAEADYLVDQRNMWGYIGDATLERLLKKNKEFALLQNWQWRDRGILLYQRRRQVKR